MSTRNQFGKMIVGGLAALAFASSPAFGTVMSETFDNDSSDVTTDPHYSQYTYSVIAGETMKVVDYGVGDHELQITMPASGSANANSTVFASGFTFAAGKPLTIAADMTGSGGTLSGWGIGFELKSGANFARVQFLPGYDGNNNLQISGTGTSTYHTPVTGIGWAPSTTALDHFSITGDGAGDFTFTLTDGAHTFSGVFTNSGLTTFTAGLLAPFGGSTFANNVVALYDNWTMESIPEPTTLLLFGLGGMLLWLRRRR